MIRQVNNDLYLIKICVQKVGFLNDSIKIGIFVPVYYTLFYIPLQTENLLRWDEKSTDFTAHTSI